MESRVSEFQESEKVTIFYHEIHKKIIRKSAILKLQTPGGIVEGHGPCAAFLENEVKNLLLTDAGLDITAQNTLLASVRLTTPFSSHHLLCKVSRILLRHPTCMQHLGVMEYPVYCTKSAGRQLANP